ncbi:crotonase/enoyl-CoA hydratase family protein [Neptunicoccus cionae]|uniref:Methylglutaconyl-CoA hydratase n=1 Tax=Neptunicoccus cionae TaxID=2035344 RepID=A0A916VRE7_9RHOB|nr:crotonase/enoyl-CoA hydratase family protein [Amylibacter cionae]GGA22262.1 methylglutaconyl-CoA hydratase [Amylibacter cionae]
MFETISLNTDSRGVTTLTLARADKHNAMNAQMIRELTQAAERIGQDTNTRVVVLAAEGRSFCAGGDLGWMKEQMAATAEQRAAGARELAGMLGALNTLPKPLIGRVQGQAFGGGIGMMSVCDIAIGVPDVKFGLTETRLGLIPATISPYVIKRMGEPMARRVMMSARLFESAEAQELGLLARVVDADALDTAIEAEVKPYFSVAPRAVEKTKRLIRGQGGEISQAQVEDSIKALVEAWEDSEATDGINAFFAKEKAPWAS